MSAPSKSERLRAGADAIFGHGRHQGSALTMVKAVGDLEHNHLGILGEPDDDAPTHLFVPRRANLNKDEWDEYRSLEPIDLLGANLAPDKGHMSALQYDSAVQRTPRWSDKVSRPTFSSNSSAAQEAEAAKEEKLRRQATSIFWLPLINPSNRLYVMWANVILLLDLTYTAFLVPILVGFEVPSLNFGWGCYIDLIAGYCYFIELVLGWHVGFVGRYNMQRKVIMDGRGIAKFYVFKGTFGIDLLTTIAWVTQIVLIVISETGGQFNQRVITAYQIVRILRLIRFFSLLRRLYATAVAATAFIFPGITFSHASIYTFNLLYGGGVMSNFFACLWNFVAIAEGLEDTWVNYYPPFIRQFGDGINALDVVQANSVPGPRRYLAGIYYIVVTIGTVGYGDIVPATTAETVVAMICILVGLVFFGLLLGAIADAMQRMSKEAQQAALFRGRMDQVDKWMRKRNLPRKLRQRIGAYYAEEWLSNTEATEEVQIMDELPYKLRKDIAFHLNRPLFAAVGLFHDFPLHIQAVIASMMTLMQVPPGFELCQEGDVADSLWLLHEGEVAALDTDMDPVERLKAPCLVAAEALLQEQDESYFLRSSTFRTRTSCVIWELRLKELLPLLNRYPDLYAKASTQAVPTHHFDYLAINPPVQHQTRAERLAAAEAAVEAAEASFNEAANGNGSSSPTPRSGSSATLNGSARSGPTGPPDLTHKSSPALSGQNGSAAQLAMSRTMQLKMQRLSTGRSLSKSSTFGSKFNMLRGNPN